MTTAEILSDHPRLSALVIGDICLDRWCTYDPAISEALARDRHPAHRGGGTEVTPGAGGTVANNLAALGAGRVAVLGAIGQDGFGVGIGARWAAAASRPTYVCGFPGIQTFTYTKLINARRA